MPDDATGVVSAQCRENPALVVANVGEAAENPCGNADNVTSGADHFAFVAVCAPTELPSAFVDHKDLGGVMNVQVVGDPSGHRGDPKAEAVWFTQSNLLIFRLRHARADQRIVFLEVGTRHFTVNESHTFRHHPCTSHDAFRGLVRGECCWI